jgi:uncharacterized protein (TIGR01244 family)
MVSNTTKTNVGYLLSKLRRFVPAAWFGSALTDIYNYLKISEALCTSGQPTANQFSSIRDAGYTTVINLAPHHAENAIEDEATLVTQLGMNYIHLPVDFKQPTQRDFDTFVEHVKNASSGKVWIHCAANMRVSAFVYRYRMQVLNEADVVARRDLQTIWEPSGVWKDFIAGKR